MRISRLVPAGVALVLVLVLATAAAEGGWFDSSSQTGTVEPKPGTNLPRKIPKKEPSTLQKMSDGTKKFFRGIGNALSPNKKAATTKKTVNPYTSAMKNAKNKSQPQKKSWLSQMFQPEEHKEPQSPKDWIGQKRLDY